MTIDVYEPQTVVAHTDSWTGVLTEVARLSEIIARTELVPKGLRGNPAAVTAVILYGREVGLPPMTALRSVYVIDGAVAMYAEAMRALCLRAGHAIEYMEADARKVTVRGRRYGEDAWHTVTWTMDDARKAGLDQRMPWRKTPRAMLKARATSELARDLFPDVISGFSAIEELDEPPGETGQKVSRRRTSAGQALTAGADGSAVEPPPVAPVPADLPPDDTAGLAEPEPEPGPVLDLDAATLERLAMENAERTARQMLGADVIPDETATPGAEPEPYTEAQRRLLHATFNELGIAQRQDRLDVTSAIIRRDVKSANELTLDEASELIDVLKRVQATGDLAELDEARRLWGLVVDEPLPWDEP